MADKDRNEQTSFDAALQDTLNQMQTSLQSLGDMIKSKFADEQVNDDIGQREAFQTQILAHSARNFDNSKMIAADEKDLAMQSKLADLELKRIAIREARIAADRAQESLDQKQSLNNAYLLSLADERKYKAGHDAQIVRHADVAIENQWEDPNEIAGGAISGEIAKSVQVPPAATEG